MDAIYRYFPGKSYFNPVGKQGLMNNSKNLLGSTSIIAKLVFLLLVIFIFIFALKIGVSLLSYIFSYSSNPVLINGMRDAGEALVIEQNPNNKEAIPILRSQNQRSGLEFTWSVWLYIKNPPLSIDNGTRPEQHKHVFNKGNDTIGPDGIVTPNNGPGLYIGNDYRSLRIVMNTFDNINTLDDKKDEIVIEDIPIEKWMNVIIRCNQHNLDVYINGTLTKSIILASIPKQNYDNVNVALNGGFSGRISLLHYYAYAAGATEIQNIVDTGPNMKTVGKSITTAKPNYLSFRWFFPEQF